MTQLQNHGRVGLDGISNINFPKPRLQFEPRSLMWQTSKPIMYNSTIYINDMLSLKKQYDCGYTKVPSALISQAMFINNQLLKLFLLISLS